MSRLTSTEVIDAGKYLDDDFDVNVLTIPHLTAILNYHNVQKPPQANKGKLIQTFNEEIVPRRAQYKRERKDSENSQASSIGINDGITGEPIHQEEKTVRRSTRAASRGVSVEPVPEPPRGRRSQSEKPESSRKASARGPKRALAQPAVLEESEPEEDEIKPVFKREDNKRRVSTKIGTGDEESPWEDTNIFQSGNESSSPVRVTKPKAPKTAKRPAHHRRDSLSAPPESPQRATFDPAFKTDMSSSPYRPTFDSSPLARRPGPDSIAVQKQLGMNDDTEDPGYTDEIVALKDFNDAISRKLAGEKSLAVVEKQQATPSMLKRVLPPWWTVLITIVLGVFVPFKMESQTIGFCDTGSSANAILASLQQNHRAQDNYCNVLLANMVNKTITDALQADALACIFNIPGLVYPPLTCTPCPPHADCTPHSATCRASFVKQAHTLSHIPYSDTVFNGWPYLGSVAFPPSCVVDPAYKAKLKAVGRDAETFLAVHRGKLICKEGKTLSLSPKEQVLKYGIKFKDLNEAMRVYAQKRRSAAGKDPKLPSDFNHTFLKAIEELAKLGVIFEAKDDKGESWVTSENAEYTVQCRIQLGANKAWVEWRTAFLSSLVVLMSILYGRRRVAYKRIEATRVAELVESSLEQLRQQEMSHHIDPVTYRQPYLSPLHLRDLILREVHSVKGRQQLWDKVEKVVENNANVRVNTEELEGDEIKVWRWVGAATPATSPRKSIGI